jgi:hypothetical protein
MRKQLVRVVLGAALVFGLTMPVGIATAADRDYGASCRQRLEDARARIDHDAARYGPDSRRVEHDRARMGQARQWCRDHHADWDHARFDVGIYLK